MPQRHSLDSLDPNSFEQMVNSLALEILGSGHTGFGPGPDAGRDGYFEGQAPYPSKSNRWKGVWYIQSKFHRPHASTNAQKWLLSQITTELNEFKHQRTRNWPDIWIVATNIDISAAGKNGTFDAAKELVRKARPSLSSRFHIWGGQKLLAFLSKYRHVAETYGHFLTPGNVIQELYDSLHDERASLEQILRFLVIKEFENHLNTKLDQAGSESDNRPGVHQLFVDIPYRTPLHNHSSLVTRDLLRSAARNHRGTLNHAGQKWEVWQRHPVRSRTWFIQGGPGQGKSTTGQYFAQLQRAALILTWEGAPILSKWRDVAQDIRTFAEKRGHWGTGARIPIAIDLKEYAQWLGEQPRHSPIGVLTFLSQRIYVAVGKHVPIGLLERALSKQRWFVAFDGLDEVPNDVKDALAAQVKDFITEVTIACNSDVSFICTSRPQGYSGQFDDLECAKIKLAPLSPKEAIDCAEPVIRIGRSDPEANKGLAILRSAIASPAVKSLMTTPLQAHIMAVVVRDGKKPPERKWQLFENFYQVIKKREANRDLPDLPLAKLLRDEEQLLRTIHNRLGFILHAKAEKSDGAQTHLTRKEFEALATAVVGQMKSGPTRGMINVLMEAATVRLVLVNTPDDGAILRFDVRQLQEFFAAEFLHESLTVDQIRDRASIIARDSHWREVLYFLLSAMAEARRLTELGELARILESINAGTVSADDSRTVGRRLARGALLAARLLRDGVLEQDKRIRHLFATAVEPLTAIAEAEDLAELCTVEHQESREWLIDYCIARLKEADFTESIGAGIILTHLVGDSDSRSEECRSLISEKPPQYKGELIRVWCEEAEESGRIAPFWLQDICVTFIVGDEWYASGLSGIYCALSCLVPGRRLMNALRARGCPPECYSLLRWAMTAHLPVDVHAKAKTRLFGCATICESNQCWQGGKFSIKALERRAINKPIPIGYGFLSILAAMVSFARSLSQSALAVLVSLLKDHAREKLEAIPFGVAQYSPFHVAHSDWYITDVEGYLAGYKVVRRRPTPTILNWSPRRGRPEDVIQLAKAYPRLGLLLYDRGLLGQEMDPPLKRRFTEIVVPEMKNDPDLLASLRPTSWGDIFERAKDSEPQMRQALAALCKGRRLNVQWRAMGHWNTRPFTVDLSTEIAFVRHIMIDCIHLLREWERQHNPPNSKETHYQSLQSLLSEFFPSIREINKVSASSHNDCEIVGYLSMLKVLHPASKTTLRDVIDSVMQNVVAYRDQDLFEIVVSWLVNNASEERLEDVEVVSTILEVSRHDLSLRRAVSPLIRLWRERSHAPTTAIDALSSWL